MRLNAQAENRGSRSLLNFPAIQIISFHKCILIRLKISTKNYNYLFKYPVYPTVEQGICASNPPLFLSPFPPPSFHRRCDVIVLGEGVGGGLARRSSYTIPLFFIVFFVHDFSLNRILLDVIRYYYFQSRSMPGRRTSVRLLLTCSNSLVHKWTSQENIMI